jgi:GTPase
VTPCYSIEKINSNDKEIMMSSPKEKVLLIGVNRNNQPNFQESIEELQNLAIACEYEVIGKTIQNLKAIHPATYIGPGKVEEAKSQLKEQKADLVIFNNELSPSQIRNLEEEWETKVLDRTSLILEIFAKRAKTREAKLQVEVARLQYALPKLIGSNESLGRQSGGVGNKNRGSGEKKLELDRRKIEEKISDLQKELDTLENERKTQKKMRNKTDLPTIALVGYTNAGKSTLMNAMVELFHKSESKKVFEKDMLFATLETSVRKITLPDHKSILLSDTVGFVNHLPHELVKAFRSTLDELRDADLLLHVIDSSHPNYQLQIQVTEETLVQIGASEIPTILVFNKADLTSQDLPSVEGDKVTLSAKKKIGIEELIHVIRKKVFNQTIKCKFLVPYEQGKIVSYLNENANIESVAYETNGTLLTVECREQDFHRFKEYIWEVENLKE